MEPLLLGSNVYCIPSIHGRSAFASQVRQIFLSERFDVVAVELPPSLQESVLEAVQALPTIQAVVYHEEDCEPFYYVPIQPSDSIIEALRLGLQEQCSLEFIDLDTPAYEPEPWVLPDEYAVRLLGVKKYYEVVAPFLPPSSSLPQKEQRERWMAYQLKRLSALFSKVLFVCGLAHLEGIRHYWNQSKIPIDDLKEIPPPYYQQKIYRIQPDSLYFLNGEIPYLTYLYERSRYALSFEEYDQLDGIKELLVEARNEYRQENPEECSGMGSGTLQILIKYLRNLCLLQKRMTPSLYDLILATKGVGGDSFTRTFLEIAKFYPYMDPLSSLPELLLTPHGGILPEEGEKPLINRLEGPPFEWKSIKLERKPPQKIQEKWASQWGRQHCSWPEEDEKIENFTAYVRRKALNLLSEDQARVEKFQSSLKDGLDIRETMRHWQKKEIYVKEVPHIRGEIGAVLFIFEEDPEGEKYPWKVTWLAEHQNESTLCFYATPYQKEMIGPGIARARYGGALFLFPSLDIHNIFQNPRFAHARNSMETLVAAATYYSRSPYIAYVAKKRPNLWMKREGNRHGKRFIFIPLSQFGQSTLQKLRVFHVLNGSHIRSYARDYIR
jgi:hypothetical protein